MRCLLSPRNYPNEQLLPWAHYLDYVHGKGQDLYQLENTPQGAATEPLTHIREITRVRVYAKIEGKTRTLIKTYDQVFSGDWVDMTGLTYTEYATNPVTDQEWAWQEIDDLQAGIELDNAKAHYLYVEVEVLIGS